MSAIVGTILILILYAAIHRRPRRWWFYFWLVSLPIRPFMFYLQPLVVDPLCHRFEPLANKDPGLTVELEHLTQRANENITIAGRIRFSLSYDPRSRGG